MQGTARDIKVRLPALAFSRLESYEERKMVCRSQRCGTGAKVKEKG